MAKVYKKKNNFFGKFFKALGVILLVGAVVVTICYFTVPEVKEFINNSWHDITFQIKY